MKGTITTAHCYTSEGIRHSIAVSISGNAHLVSHLAHHAVTLPRAASVVRSLAWFHGCRRRRPRLTLEPQHSGIEHGNLLDEPTAKLMAAKGIYLTPTLAVHGVGRTCHPWDHAEADLARRLQIISKPPYGRGFLLESQLEKNEVVRKAGLNACVIKHSARRSKPPAERRSKKMNRIQIAEKAGVTVCLGSDMLSSMVRADHQCVVAWATYDVFLFFQHPLQTNEVWSVGQSWSGGRANNPVVLSSSLEPRFYHRRQSSSRPLATLQRCSAWKARLAR
jgi:imidazolonepropionase-like amidohydrolase